jgi:hypothetical protein
MLQGHEFFLAHNEIGRASKGLVDISRYNNATV